MDGATHHIGCAVELRKELAYTQRIAHDSHVPPLGRRCGHLTWQSRRRHLAAGHAVHGIVDKDDADVLATAGAVDDLAHSDRGQIAVALVREDDAIRQDALDAGGHGRRAPVRRLNEVHVHVVVDQHRTPNGRHANG